MTEKIYTFHSNQNAAGLQANGIWQLEIGFTEYDNNSYVKRFYSLIIILQYGSRFLFIYMLLINSIFKQDL